MYLMFGYVAAFCKKQFMSLKYNQQDATFSRSIFSISCSTCFRRFFRPSSGAQNCTYVSYCQTNTATSGSISSTIAAGSSTGLTITDAVCTVCAPDDGQRNRLKHVEKFIEINRKFYLIHDNNR